MSSIQLNRGSRDACNIIVFICTQVRVYTFVRTPSAAERYEPRLDQINELRREHWSDMLAKRCQQNEKTSRCGGRRPVSQAHWAHRTDNPLWCAIVVRFAHDHVGERDDALMFCLSVWRLRCCFCVCVCVFVVPWRPTHRNIYSCSPNMDI